MLKILKSFDIAENWQLQRLTNWFSFLFESDKFEKMLLYICVLGPLIHRFYPPLPVTFFILIILFASRLRNQRKWICVNLENWKFNWLFTHLFLSSFVGVALFPLGLNATLFCRQTSHMEVGHRWEKTRAFCYTMGRMTIAQKSTIWEENSAKHLFGVKVVKNSSWSQ
jgi:hypothetical protein